MLATLWWKRATRQGVIASILTGLAISVVFIIMLLTGMKTDPLFGLPTAGGPGVFGVTGAFLVLIVVSLMTRDTGKDTVAFLTLAHKSEE
jgi:cation/acetate symporter